MGVFPGAYQAFAECVNFALDDRVLVNAKERVALVGNAPVHAGLVTRPADYELRVRQLTAEEVEVQLRQRWTFDKNGAGERVWRAVQDCARA